MKKKYLIISPHFDDAFLSTFSLIFNHFEDVFIINVFTAIDYTSQLSEQQIKCLAEDLNILPEMVNLNSLTEWIKIRKKENYIACKRIGVEYANLGFSDSLFRLRKDEEKLKKEILEKIKEINFDYIIFPIGIGNHIDHLILNEISRDKFFIKKVLYYYDSPYFGRGKQDFSEFKKLDENIYNNKIKVLSEFKSQINWLKKETNIIEVLKFERILNGE